MGGMWMEGSYRVERRKGSEKEIDIGEESRRVNFSGSFVWSSRQSSDVGFYVISTQ